MRMVWLWLALLTLSGCSDTLAEKEEELRRFLLDDAEGECWTVRVYSGREAVKEYRTKGRMAWLGSPHNATFIDRATGQLVYLQGSVVAEQSEPSFDEAMAAMREAGGWWVDRIEEEIKASKNITHWIKPVSVKEDTYYFYVGQAPVFDLPKDQAHDTSP